MATNEHQRQRLEITVSVDSALSVSYEVRGPDSLLVGLLGGLHVAEDAVLRRLRQVSNVKETSSDAKPLCATPEANNLAAEVSMSKDAALVAYWNAAQKIGDRMRAIAAADPTSIYDVPLPLLTAL